MTEENNESMIIGITIIMIFFFLVLLSNSCHERNHIEIMEKIKVKNKCGYKYKEIK